MFKNVAFSLCILQFSLIFKSSLKLEKLVLRSRRLTQAESKHCARAVFSLVKLRELEMKNIKADDKFFTVMSQIAPKSQVL